VKHSPANNFPIVNKRLSKQFALAQGFTLLEVLIALVIFGISALVILEQSSRSIDQQFQLEEKTLALWLAENSLESTRLEKQWPDTGTHETKINSANREWLIQQTVEGTPNPLLRKVTINVYSEDKSRSLTSLTGFVGKN